MSGPLLLAALLLGSVSFALAGTSLQFTVEPTMARGAATAPVTIVEFSDYQ